MVQLNEDEDDLTFQRPRSHSLPNLTFRETDNTKEDMVFKVERNFGYEIQEYFALRKELRRRKMQILNGEHDTKSRLIDQDPK
jgi:hypothetical protein